MFSRSAPHLSPSLDDANQKFWLTVVQMKINLSDEGWGGKVKEKKEIVFEEWSSGEFGEDSLSNIMIILFSPF